MNAKTSLALIAGVTLATLANDYAQTAFTKITTGPVVTDGADGVSCAWVDFDGDGYLDLYVSCSRTAANLLYRNDGHGGFTPVTTNRIVKVGPGSESTSWADVDNDGRIDLFVSRESGQGLLFHQESDGSFTQTTLNTGTFGSAWGDYDNDGFVDLLVGDSSRNILWHNNGQGNLDPVMGTTIRTAGFRPNITWIDYNNDRRPDVFVTTGGTTGSGTARLYRNDGNGLFTPITTGALAELASNSTGAAWGDYDNDGYPDVFVCRLDNTFSTPLPSMLFHNNGDGTFTQVKQSPFTDDKGFGVSCSWGDYDNDGWLDLIVTNFGNGGNNRLYHNNGDGTFTRVDSESVATDQGSSTGAVWGDYDRDGFLDLFIANSTVGGGDSNDFLYHNVGNSNNWLSVRCVGTRSNRSAIGTKVRAKATINGKSVWQLREINTGDGWSQSALEGHFGLGQSTNVETLRIEWPSGTVQEFQNVPAKQFLTFMEPPQLTATLSNGIPTILLEGGRNFAYTVRTSTNLTSWSVLGSFAVTNFNGNVSILNTNVPSAGYRFFDATVP